MATIQDIETALLSINETTFQELCDDYLTWSEDSFPDLNRPGSQKGKKKTKKGTPDTYWLLPSGKYVFAEYTTKNKKDGKAAFLKKLKDDVKKCITPSVTKIQPESIHRILLCFNSEILPGEIEELKKELSKTSIKLEVKSLDTITRNIYSRYQFLAHKHLGLQIDSGQILNPKTFSEEYASGYSISTPLNNRFLFREEELKNIRTMLLEHDILILTGAPGVGKSKLALTAMEEMVRTKPSYEPYCISNKHVPIFDDLKSYIKTGKDYVVMIDDANRQSENLLQILGHYKGHRKGKLKIIITVRDYAFEYIKNKCSDVTYSSLSINPLSDDHLKDILKSDDFKVTDILYVTRILEIAKGNPRLAIMAAKLAIKHQRLDPLYNLYDFYSYYFQSFITDIDVLNTPSTLKVLGLVSFFYTIDVSDKSFYNKLLLDFNITNQKFVEASSILERHELFESSSDNTTIRISDQMLSTYYFYKVFLHDRSLDFKTLLFNYFPANSNRFRDTIIPANNDFGYEVVKKTVSNTLLQFLDSISDDSVKYHFFDIFWLYFQEECLAYIYEGILRFPVDQIHAYVINKTNNSITWDNDRFLTLLSRFLHHFNSNLIAAIEISIEYINRKSELYNDVFKMFSDHLMFTYEDETYSFFRQSELTKYLTSADSKKNPILQSLFFDLFPVMLETTFRVHGSSWQKNTISFYHYPLPTSQLIKEIRTNLWIHFEKVFKSDVVKAKEAFFKYINPSMDFVPSILESDLPLVINLINKHFSPLKFYDCYLVHKLIRRYEKIQIHSAEFSFLKEKFYSKSYKIYKLIDLSRLRGKKDYEYENIDFEKFEKLKEIEIKYSLKITSLPQFKEFYKYYIEIISTPNVEKWSFNNALDVVLQEIYITNFSLTVSCLLLIQKTGNKSGYIPHKIFPTLCNDKAQSEIFYSSVLNGSTNYPEEINWRLVFLQFLNHDFVTTSHYNTLLACYKNCSSRLYFDFSYLSKFTPFDSNVYYTILKLFVEKADLGLLPRLDFHFFERDLKHYSDLTLPKKAYLFCDSVEQHYDYDCKDLFSIVKLDRSFLLEYIKFVSQDKYAISGRDYINLSIIWQLEYPENLLKSIFKHFLSKDFFYAGEHFLNSFFKRLSPVHQEKAITFLTNYQKINSKKVKESNLVLDIYRHSFNELYHSAICTFLKLNSNFEIFKKLELLANSFSGSGHTVWAEVQASELEAILVAINKLPMPLKYTQHKLYLKSWIASCKRSAETERKRRFRDDRW